MYKVKQVLTLAALTTGVAVSLMLASRGTFTDVVIGGTGTYEGATGTLTGTVKLEGSNARPAGTATVKLSGTIDYDP